MQITARPPVRTLLRRSPSGTRWVWAEEAEQDQEEESVEEATVVEPAVVEKAASVTAADDDEYLSGVRARAGARTGAGAGAAPAAPATSATENTSTVSLEFCEPDVWPS